MCPGPATAITDGLRTWARRQPGRCALDDGRRRVSYGELDAVVRELAHELRRVLPESGARAPAVGLLLRSPVALLEAFSAAAVAGGAAMVLDPTWSAAELAAVLGATPPEVLLTDHSGAGRVAGMVPGPRVHLLDDAPGQPLGGPPKGVPLPAVPGERAFYVGFTSGTTGTPKGFVRSHASWVASFTAAASAIQIAPGDVVVAPGPLQHSLFCYAAVHGLSAGAEVHVRRRFAPGEVLALLARVPAGHLYAVPSMLAALARTAPQGGGSTGDAPRLRTVISSGAPLPPRDERRISELFPGAQLVEFFGASELSFVTVRRRGDRTPRGSVGRPFPGVELSIRDDAGRELGPREAGRVHVRSPMVFSGYLHDADALADRPAAPEAWTSVGDVGWCDDDGYLFLLGRDGNMVLSGGINIYPEEVEAVLRGLPQVADAAVVGLPDPARGELLCAVVVWRPGATLPRSALRAHCRSRLAPAKRPRRYLVAQDLPRTPSGKISRPALRAAILAGTATAELL